MTKETLYERLGLPRDATPEEIQKAYRDIARRLHPDLHIKPGMTDRFMAVQEAFEILSDPAQKAEYDTQLPLATKHPNPVTVSTNYSRKTLVRSFEPQLIYALVDLNTRQESLTDSRPQLNLCLVIDCSTSMQGVRLDTAKETAIELVRQLQPNDILSIVRFSDRAEVLLPANNLNNQRNIELQVQMLRAGGGTEIYQGLNLGMHEIRRFRHVNRINHIILITDGRTYGDEGSCLQLADQATMHQVGISAFGIGGSWNDAFLDTLTAKTGGSSLFISNAKDIRQFILEKAIRLGNIYANQVTYNFETPANVDLSYAFRINPDTTPLSTTTPIIIGAVPRKNRLAVLFEFHVNSIPQDLSQVTLAEGQLSYQTPGDADLSTYIQRLVFRRPISPVADSSPPPMVIVQAMSYLTLYRMQEKARADMARGDIQAASRRLQNLATHLLAQGQRELARYVLNEISHIQQHHSFSTEGEKQIKYGTRSLILPTSREEKEHD
jgi:Ca-activated chloride channel family protein